MDFNVTEKTCFSVQLSLTRLSLRNLLQEYFLTCLEADNFLLAKEQVPVYRLKDTQVITYRCAIALSLSKSLQQSPLEVANRIAKRLYSSPHPQLDFWVSLSPPGWLDFQLSDRALAIWLQSLLDTPLPTQKTPPHAGTEDLFLLQYTHARCCSLLRLGEREGLIPFPEQTENLHPCLNSCSEGVSLRLKHPQEQHLIETLLSVADASQTLSAQEAIQWGTTLSQDFLAFDYSCRICGDVKMQTRPLAQARLQLIAVTRKCLEWLLQEQFGVLALLEV